jgi:large subunit ribosomal protein L23
MALTIYNIIKAPVISQKAYRLQAINQVVFKVDKNANAPMIKEATEKLFNVKVISVNTQIRKPKTKRVGRVLHAGSTVKYAYITLAKGYKIDLFDQVIGGAAHSSVDSEKS